MKSLLLFLSLLIFSLGYSQSLPINFESSVTTSDFVNFDGGTSVVVANPSKTGINLSDSVGRMVRDSGQIWGGSKITLSSNLSFSVLTKLSMKVYTTAPIGTVVKFKLESSTGSGSAEVNAVTTVTGAWETLEWIFAGTPNTFDEVVFMFDFGNFGNGTASSTFYFDDVAQVVGPPAPSLLSLPLTFQLGEVSSDFLDFSGAVGSVITNPQISGINISNKVGEIVRYGGDIWAGSKIIFATPISFATNWVISMKIYTTAPVGTRLKLEVEGSPGIVTLDALTTQTGAWETVTWNFHNQTGTFNRMAFLFDFGVVGNGTATSTFLFDDIEQLSGPALPTPLPATLPVDFESSVISSDFRNFFGGYSTVIPNPQMVGVNTSAKVGQFVRSGGQSWAQSKLILSDSMDFSSKSSISMKVYTDAPVGTLLKLKVESTGSGAANEKDVLTTVSGGWATYEWDFAGDPPVYNVLTFMLGYGTPNTASPTATYLIDDIQQTIPGGTLNIESLTKEETIQYYPNPSTDRVNFSSKEEKIASIVLFDVLGNQVASITPNSSRTSIDVSNLPNGIYIAKVTMQNNSALRSIKLVVEH